MRVNNLMKTTTRYLNCSNRPVLRNRGVHRALVSFSVILGIPFLAAAQPDLTRWSDDFSDPTTLTKNWDIYGFLASGITKETPLGKGVGGKESRPEWWQIVDGALRGQSFPEEQHPSGIGRRVQGTDVRLKCRFKIPHKGLAAASFRGDNPIVERNFTVGAIQIKEDRILASIFHRYELERVTCFEG